jgi:hypothetical protein
LTQQKCILTEHECNLLPAPVSILSPGLITAGAPGALPS